MVLLGPADEDLVQQTKLNPCLHFFLFLAAFRFSATFDLSMILYVLSRLGKGFVSWRNERVVRYDLKKIPASDSQELGDNNVSVGRSTSPLDQ